MMFKRFCNSAWRPSLVVIAALLNYQHAALTFLSVLMPILAWRSSSRRMAFACAFAWYGSISLSNMTAIHNFFPEWPMYYPAAIWAIHASILAGCIAMGWSQTGSPLRKLLALLLTVLPPIGFIGWLSPLLAAGTLLPGSGWIGLILTTTLIIILSERMGLIHGALIATYLAAAIGMNAAAPIQGKPGWVGINTELGKMPHNIFDRVERRRYITDITKSAIKNGNKVVLLPEAIAGLNNEALQFALMELDALAKKRGATVLIGVEDPQWIGGKMDSYRNAILAIGVDSGIVGSSRIPVPFGDWRPHGAQAAPLASDLLTVQGEQVALSICFEDFLIWPHRGLLSGKATAMLAPANQWSYSGTYGAMAQDRSRELLARLAGVPLIVAANQ